MTRSHKKDISQIMPLSDIYAIISGMNPYVYNERKDEEIKVHSVYGEGVDETPSMFINNRKGRFYCHRSGFGGGAPEMVAGKKVEPHELGAIRRMIEQWARNGGCPNDHYEWTKDGEIVPPKSTEHLILKGIPKAWNYFRIAMQYGYKRNPQIMLAIKRYMSPAIAPDNPEEVMPPIYDYVAQNFGWCDLSNALVIPYGLNGVTALEMVYWMPCGKKIVMYPLNHHRSSEAFQKMHAINDNHSFFSGTKDRPQVMTKPWPAGIGKMEDIPTDIIVCEGVKDALIARYHGFFSVAHHGGAMHTHKLETVKNLADNKDGTERDGTLFIAMDNDEAGREGAYRVKAMFSERGPDPIIVDIANDEEHWVGFDLFNYFVDTGHTSDDLRKAMTQAMAIDTAKKEIKAGATV